MTGGMGYSVQTSPGHSNRFVSAKFIPGDENIIISGGWDNTVQIWEVVNNKFLCPHICDDSLDVFGNEVVTGAWRSDNQLELWNFGSGQRIAGVPWSNHPSVFNSSACMLYAAQFSKEGQGRYIDAGGSGANEAKIFDHHKDNEVVGTITGLSRGIFAIDFSQRKSKNINCRW
jgi:WD40 repeat protein